MMRVSRKRLSIIAWLRGNITPEQIDYVAFYDKPLRKFERLLETYLAYAPAGYRSFRKAMPVWLQQKLYMPREIRTGCVIVIEDVSFSPSIMSLTRPVHFFRHRLRMLRYSRWTVLANGRRRRWVLVVEIRLS
jgi:predicted NodU family carbamoyl transferase